MGKIDFYGGNPNGGPMATTPRAEANTEDKPAVKRGPRKAAPAATEG